MKLIFDSTPLIYFAKAGLINLLKKLPDEKIIPKLVYEEVVTKGKDIDKCDAFIIDELVKSRVFILKESREAAEFSKVPKLHKADAEVLALAREMNGIAIIDDMAARNIAIIEGIEYGGSIWLLFRLVKKKIIKKTEAKNSVDNFIKIGWRCSTELYSVIMKELEEL